MGREAVAPSATTLAEFNSASYARFHRDTTGSTAAAAGAIWVTNGVNQNITVGGTGTLTLAGNLTVNTNANTAILLDDTTNNSSLTISAPITLSNSTSFIANNTGTLTVQTGALTLASSRNLNSEWSEWLQYRYQQCDGRQRRRHCREHFGHGNAQWRQPEHRHPDPDQRHFGGWRRWGRDQCKTLSEMLARSL